MNDHCKGLFGFFFGHKFRPRYTTSRVDSNVHHPPPAPEALEQLYDAVSSGDETDVIETYERMLRNGNDVEERQYMGDVCVRCGKVVKP